MSRYQLPNPFMPDASLRGRIVFDDPPSPSPSGRNDTSSRAQNPDPDPYIEPYDNPNFEGPIDSALPASGFDSAASNPPSPSPAPAPDFVTSTSGGGSSNPTPFNGVTTSGDNDRDNNTEDEMLANSGAMAATYPTSSPDPSPAPDFVTATSGGGSSSEPSGTFNTYTEAVPLQNIIPPADDNYTPTAPSTPEPAPAPDFVTAVPTPTPTPEPTPMETINEIPTEGYTPLPVPGTDTSTAEGVLNASYDDGTLYAVDGKIYMGNPYDPNNLFTGETDGVQFVDGVAVTDFNSSSEVNLPGDDVLNPPSGDGTPETPTPGTDTPPTPGTDTPPTPGSDGPPSPDGPPSGDGDNAETTAYNNLSAEDQARVDSGDLVWNAETGAYEAKASNTDTTAGGLPLTVTFPDGSIVNGTVDADGNVVDENGNVIGTWDGTTFTRSDGTTTTATLQQVTIGMADGTTITAFNDGEGNILDADGNQIGTIVDGKFVPTGSSVDSVDNNGNSNTGTVDTGYTISEGVIYDGNGNIIGYEDGYQEDTETLAENLESATGTDTSGMTRAEIIKLIQEYMASFNSANYDPAAFMNAFGFALDPNFSGGVIPSFMQGSQSGVYMRRLVKDRDTGELRYIDVPIGGAFMTDTQRMSRRSGFGTAISL